MKHLRIFNSIEEFEANKPSMDTPFVVLEKDTPKVIYSNLVEITEDDITAGQYIDLGLPSGLKWASCNLGATSPCEYGDYYMWGSVTPNTEDDCSWAHAPFNNGSSSFDLAYFNEHKSEWLDGDILKTEYDAAYQATGGAAHMPTKADYDELLANTTNQWCQCTVLGNDHNEHSVNGRLFTATNGNSIFIPAIGSRDGSSFEDRDDFSRMWISSLYTDEPDSAWMIDFSSGYCGEDYCSRCCGLGVRPVSE